MTDYQLGVEQASAVYQEIIREYVTENAKLRELVRDMAVVICVYDQCVTVDDCPPALPMFTDKMRELGIEVDA